MKKFFIFTFTLLLMLTQFTFAKEYSNDYLKVQLISCKILTEYKENDVFVNYEKNDNSIIARIYEKNSNSLIDTISEKSDISIKEIQTLKEEKSPSTYNTTFTRLFSLDKSDLEPQAYVSAYCNVSADFSWMQVNRLISASHTAGSSGSYDLVGTNTYDVTGSYPESRSITLRLTGVIQTGSSYSVSDSISANLEWFGYSVSRTSSSNWYARKPYNQQVSIKIMQWLWIITLNSLGIFI